MAKGPYADSVGRYVVTESGDCLTEIAVKYGSGYSDHKRIATLNGIEDVDEIATGVFIYIEKFRATTTKTTTTIPKYKPDIKQFGQSASDSSKLFITWTFSEPSWVDEFVIVWKYYVRGITAMQSGSDCLTPDTTENVWTYYIDIPTDCHELRAYVTSTSKYKDEEKKTVYFKPTSSSWQKWSSKVILTAPSSPPDVEIEGYTITASVKDIDIDGAKYIQFQLSKVNETTPLASETRELVNQRASCHFTVRENYDYIVRCRASATSTNTGYVSEWTNYSSTIKTIPSNITHISSLERTDGSTVLVQWPALANVTEYIVQYTTNEAYFDSSDDVKFQTVTVNKAYLTGLSEGETYFVRIRATNDQGSSGWANKLEDGTVASIVLGNAPSAPTTWSSTTTATVGEAVNLYWVHNSSDGSAQTAASLMLYVYSNYNSSTPVDSHEIDITSYIPTSADDDADNDAICKYVLSSNEYSDGYEIRWQIRTCGVTEEYSAWSALRSVRFYAPATLQLRMINADGTGVGMTAEDIVGTWYFDQVSEYHNRIPISTGASEVSVYNNVGYRENTAINSAAGPTDSSGTCLTGFIPCKVGDVVRLSNLDIGPNVANSKVAFYTSRKIYIGLITGGATWYWNREDNETNFEAVSDSDGNYISFTIKSVPGMTEDCAYMRIVAANITQDSIVTVNDEATASFSLDFTCNGESFIGISISTLGDDPYMKYSREDGTDVSVWGRGDNGFDWVDTAYKSITVSDGTNTALEFLNAVASKREFGDGTLTSFPFTISAIAGPTTQKPMSYHLSIVSNDDYIMTDEVGKSRTVKTGDEIYSKVFDVIETADYITDKRDLSATLSAGDIDLQNGCEYTPTCTVAMDSGLMAEATLPSFTVNWTDISFTPGALITIDQDTLTANIMPYCENLIMKYYQVSLDSGVYTKSPIDLGFVYGELVPGAMTTDEERVYSGMTGDGDEVYFCKVIEEQSVENVWLSVYRREFDGSFTKINDADIDAGKNTTVVDPHPALDYARYRIVAKTKTTGAVTYYDLPGEYVGGTAIVIQWDEAWTNFEVNEDSTSEQPPWSGSMLKLPYNIDVTESNVSDKTSIEYIGRAHPVVYYGTQLGVSATWSVDIPKEDKETLYALRRLSRWMGDVYVREPSGSGYWATIDVSFTQKHTEKTIPVSISITQVEGGA